MTPCTSNFARNAKDTHAVAISRGVPKWYTGRRFLELAPRGWMLKIKDEDEFTKVYRETVLAKLDPRKVVEAVGKDAVLLCWEKPGEFCHRRLVAEWLEETMGEEVPEAGEAQGSLF